jgi:hypothetical protein
MPPPSANASMPSSNPWGSAIDSGVSVNQCRGLSVSIPVTGHPPPACRAVALERRLVTCHPPEIRVHPWLEKIGCRQNPRPDGESRKTAWPSRDGPRLAPRRQARDPDLGMRPGNASGDLHSENLAGIETDEIIVIGKAVNYSPQIP